LVVFFQKALIGVNGATVWMNQVTPSYRVLAQNGFVYLVLVLLLILGSLFALFTFLATTTMSEALGVILFVVVAGLLIGAYMVGLMVLAFVGMVFLAGRTDKGSNPTASKPPT